MLEPIATVDVLEVDVVPTVPPVFLISAKTDAPPPRLLDTVTSVELPEALLTSYD